jgi:hypothetical protein
MWIILWYLLLISRWLLLSLALRRTLTCSDCQMDARCSLRLDREYRKCSNTCFLFALSMSIHMAWKSTSIRYWRFWTLNRSTFWRGRREYWLRGTLSISNIWELLVKPSQTSRPPKMKTFSPQPNSAAASLSMTSTWLSDTQIAVSTHHLSHPLTYRPTDPIQKVPQILRCPRLETKTAWISTVPISKCLG